MIKDTKLSDVILISNNWKVGINFPDDGLGSRYFRILFMGELLEGNLSSCAILANPEPQQINSVFSESRVVLKLFAIC